MTTNATQELYQLYKAEKLTPFSQELYSALDAIFLREGLRSWTISDAARKLDVTRMTARGWLRGFNIPDPESCRRIAFVTGVSADQWLTLAGHPTFSAMLTEVEKHRHEWVDGQYIFTALDCTQDRRWQRSTSLWKVLAQDQLERWRSSTSDEEFHSIAFRVAAYIDAWNLDRTRDLPPPQRRVAMVLAS